LLPVVVRRPVDEQQLRESLVDWHIPFTDVQFKDCLRAGLRNSVYRSALSQLSHGSTIRVVVHAKIEYVSVRTSLLENRILLTSFSV